MATTRRRLLEAGLTVGVASATGCLERLPFLNDHPDYARWLYPPGTVEQLDTFITTANSPATLIEFAPVLDRSFRNSLYVGAVDRLGFEWATVHRFLTVQLVNEVVVGSFDADEASTRLRNASFSHGGSIGPFDQYRRDDRLAAVREGELVTTRSPDRDRALRALIEARTGNGDRYVATDDGFQSLVEAVGTGARLDLQTFPRTAEDRPRQGVFAGAVGAGGATELGETDSTVREAVLFARDAAVDTEAVRQWYRNSQGEGETFENVTDVSVSRQGRAVVVSGSIPTADLV